MTSVSKDAYISKLDNIFNKYSNTYHSTIKMKAVDANACIESSKEISSKDPKLQIADIARILKYENIFANGYTPNWSEKVFMIEKFKNTVPWTCVINDLNGEEIVGAFYEKELQKVYQKEFRTDKTIKKKCDKLYVKWKEYNNSFNRWIYKKDIV